MSIINLSFRSSSSDVVAKWIADSWLIRLVEKARRKVNWKPINSRRKMRTNKPATKAEEMGLGTKKTFLVLFTVVGCIAILFPKILYPMLMGPSTDKEESRTSSEFTFPPAIVTFLHYSLSLIRSPEARETLSPTRCYSSGYAGEGSSYSTSSYCADYWTTWSTGWAATETRIYRKTSKFSD